MEEVSGGERRNILALLDVRKVLARLDWSYNHVFHVSNLS